jgi:lysophospholipase L1-like esterase
MNSGDRTAIERFVRGTLGCRCPDEVFQHVEVGPLLLPAGGETGRRLVIGNRLLIHLVTALERADLPGWVESLAVAGRDERDRLAYSRYRLVVGSTTEMGDHSSLEQRFTQALEGDDRAHLHVLAADRLPIV